MQMRPLASTDHTRGHLSVLTVLTSAPDPSESAYTTQFNTMKSTPNTYYTIVIVNKPTDTIVGVGCVFMERKFLRNLGLVGHIEDIAVDKKVQGAKLGLRIIQALTGISEAQGAYKTILNCSTENIRTLFDFFTSPQFHRR
jgi:glucosamine-phosphate N-acetyltransferase